MSLCAHHGHAIRYGTGWCIGCEQQISSPKPVNWRANAPRPTQDPGVDFNPDDEQEGR